MSVRNQPFTLVEIDVPTCTLTYGTAPCTAAVPTTGDQKCFNTIRTCQDRDHFTAGVTTLRVCTAREDIPLEYDALPNLGMVNVTPGVIDPGNSIGVRASVKVSCYEHPTSDALFDKYLTSRTYAPFTQGTFWAKLRARVPSLQGMALRVLRGQFGDALSTYHVEHYIVETAIIDDGGIDITAKDALALCDPSKAQCPVLSNGRLGLDIGAADVTASLTPTGIGDLEYPAAGYICFSNKEVVAFTRIADALSLTRNQFGTRNQAHEADSVAQLVVVFDSVSAADIVYSLLVDYTPGIDASWCDLAAWQAEADLYIGHLYKAVLPAPTSVKTLLDEMMQQAGCSLWWDPALQQVMFQTLRPVSPSAFVFDEDRLSGFKAQEQPDKRVSESWTYYGLADPTNKLDKESNFQMAVLRVDADSSVDYPTPAFRKNLARWIASDNRPAAERLNAMILARFRDAPRRARFSLPADSPVLPEMGTGILAKSFSLQNADGSPATVPFYITSLDHEEAMVHLELEELNFVEPVDETDRAVFIDTDAFNVNLRDLYDSLYSSVPPGAIITFTVAPGIYIGGQILGSRSTASLVVGDWPVDTVVRLVIGSASGTESRVLGRGGDAGGYPGPSSNGQDGQTAIYTRRALVIVNYGVIGAGGGGGQGRIGFTPGFDVAGGGGGAGYNGIQPLGGRIGGAAGNGGAPPGNPGTTTAGGSPGNSMSGPGGRGGNLGEGGRTYDNAPGHTQPGYTIDGYSFVTFETMGTLTGSSIN